MGFTEEEFNRLYSLKDNYSAKDLTIGIAKRKYPDTYQDLIYLGEKYGYEPVLSRMFDELRPKLPTISEEATALYGEVSPEEMIPTKQPTTKAIPTEEKKPSVMERVIKYGPPELGALSGMLQAGTMVATTKTGQKIGKKLAETYIEANRSMDEAQEKRVKWAIKQNRMQRRQLPDIKDLEAVIYNETERIMPGKSLIETHSWTAPAGYKPLNVSGDENENRVTIRKLMEAGEIPTQEEIIKQLGEERGTKLIANMQVKFPNVFSDDYNWKWRGELSNILPASMIRWSPRELGFIDDVLQTGRDFMIDEINDPREWLLDATLGKLVFKPAFVAASKSDVFRIPISEVFKGNAREIVDLRKALSNNLVDYGVSKEILDQLADLPEDEIRAMGKAIAEGHKIDLQVPKDMLPATKLEYPSGKKIVETAKTAQEVKFVAGKIPKEVTEEIIPQAAKNNLAVRTGYTDYDIEFLRAMGLDDAEIVDRAAKERMPEYLRGAEFDIGDRVKLWKQNTHGKILQSTDDGFVVQIETPEGKGMKIKVGNADVISPEAVTIPSAEPSVPIELTPEPPKLTGMVPIFEGDVPKIGDKVTVNEQGLQGEIFSETKDKFSILLDNGMKVKVARDSVKLPPTQEVGDIAVVKNRPDVGFTEVKSVKGDKTELTTAIGETIIVNSDDVAVTKKFENVSTFDQLRARQAKEHQEIMKQDAEGGFLRLGRRGAKLTSKPPEESLRNFTKEVTGKTDYAEATIAGMKGRAWLDNFVDHTRDAYKSLKRLIWIRNDAELLEAVQSKKSPYSELEKTVIRRFADNKRTGIDTYGARSQARSHMEIAQNILGGLDSNEVSWFTVMASIRSDAARGTSIKNLPLMADISGEDTMTLFNKLYRDAPEKAKRAFDAYYAYNRAFTMDQIIMPGNMAVDEIFDFYMHHDILEHLYGGDLQRWYKGKQLMQRTPYYLKKAEGSPKTKAVDPRVITNYHAAVYAENERNDFMLREIPTIHDAVMKTLKAELPEEEYAELAKNIQMGRYRPGKGFYGKYELVQLSPGRYIYEGTVADPEKLGLAFEDALISADEAEKILGSISKLPVDEQYNKLLEFTNNIGPRGGDALRKALILGRYKPMYLVPNPIAKTIKNLSQANEYVPLLREAMGLTSAWKRWTLYWAFMPYQLRNIFGDSINAAYVAPGAAKHFFTTTPKVLGAYHELQAVPTTGLDKYDLSGLNQITRKIAGQSITYEFTDFDKRVLQGSFDSDILGAGFLREFLAYNPIGVKDVIQRSAKGPMSALSAVQAKGASVKETYFRWSAMREASTRIALYARLLEKADKWGALHPGEEMDVAKVLGVPQFAKDIKYLTPEQAIGYVARNAIVDYADIPDWYRRWFRGFLFPFITFKHKNAINQGKLVAAAATHPKLLGRLSAQFVAPLVAIQTWNNTDDRAYIYDRLGRNKQGLLTTVLFGTDPDENGNPTYAYIISPPSPTEEAIEVFDIDYMIQMANLIKRGVITPDEATKRVVNNIPGAVYREGSAMATPIYQILMGIKDNKDPYSKEPVYDPTRQPDDIGMYGDVAEYVLGKFVTSAGQYARSQKGNLAIPDFIPANLPTPLRRAAAMFLQYPLGVQRAVGFRKVDLRTGALYEMGIEREILEKRDNAFMRDLDGEFRYKHNSLDTAKAMVAQTGQVPSVIDFVLDDAAYVVELAKEEAQNINDNETYYPDTTIGKILFDARKKNLFIDEDIFTIFPDVPVDKLPMNVQNIVERIEERIYSPYSLYKKLDVIVKDGLHPITGQKLSKAEIEQLKTIMYEEQDLANEERIIGSPKAIRPETLNRAKRILGYNK